ncbi:MAG: hypothetical protein WBQ23_01325 [Bacteroidota bacterium]
MSDSNDTSMMNGDVPFESERLLNDLRAMPKVSAPMDFAYHLSAAIAEMDSGAELPWWKRFFRHAADGGFRVPAFAYGAAAVMVVMIVSVYVVSVTDFQQEIQKEFAPGRSATEEAPVESDAVTDSDELTPNNTMKGPASLVPSESVQTASPIERNELKADRKDGESAPPAVKQTQIAAPDKKSERQSGRSSVSPAAPAPPEEKSSEPIEFRTRGILSEEQDSPVMDSMVSDSIRRLDSLRRLKKDIPTKPSTDPR